MRNITCTPDEVQAIYSPFVRLFLQKRQKDVGLYGSAVLTFIEARTLAWKKSEEAIPYRHFVDGVKDSRGTVITGGIPASLRKIRETLAELVEEGWVLRRERKVPGTQADASHVYRINMPKILQQFTLREVYDCLEGIIKTSSTILAGMNLGIDMLGVDVKSSDRKSIQEEVSKLWQSLKARIPFLKSIERRKRSRKNRVEDGADSEFDCKIKDIDSEIDQKGMAPRGKLNSNTYTCITWVYIDKSIYPLSPLTKAIGEVFSDEDKMATQRRERGILATPKKAREGYSRTNPTATALEVVQSIKAKGDETRRSRASAAEVSAKTGKRVTKTTLQALVDDLRKEDDLLSGLPRVVISDKAASLIARRLQEHEVADLRDFLHFTFIRWGGYSEDYNTGIRKGREEGNAASKRTSLMPSLPDSWVLATKLPWFIRRYTQERGILHVTASKAESRREDAEEIAKLSAEVARLQRANTALQKESANNRERVREARTSRRERPASSGGGRRAIWDDSWKETL